MGRLWMPVGKNRTNKASRAMTATRTKTANRARRGREGSGWRGSEGRASGSGCFSSMAQVGMRGAEVQRCGAGWAWGARGGDQSSGGTDVARKAPALRVQRQQVQASRKLPLSQQGASIGTVASAQPPYAHDPGRFQPGVPSLSLHSVRPPQLGTLPEAQGYQLLSAILLPADMAPYTPLS